MTWFFNCESELSTINKYFSRVRGRRGWESVLELTAAGDFGEKQRKLERVNVQS
jgi:hypothetical protein